MTYGQRISSRDPDCVAEFLAWQPQASERDLDVISALVSMLEEGYLDLGPIKNNQSVCVQRQDGQYVDIYGEVKSGLCLFVGICENTHEIRTLILGPSPSKGWEVAKVRVANW